MQDPSRDPFFAVRYQERVLVGKKARRICWLLEAVERLGLAREAVGRPRRPDDSIWNSVPSFERGRALSKGRRTHYSINKRDRGVLRDFHKTLGNGPNLGIWQRDL